MELRAEGIKRTFFRNSKNSNVFTALEGTDFVLQEGKVTEITGRSGSGKTTFTNILAGLLAPTEGKVWLDGRDLYAMDDLARAIFRNQNIGIIPQGQTGLQCLTLLENVMAPAMMYQTKDLSEQELSARALDLLDQVGICHLADAYPNELSGGELRRMAIARALINKPAILIADEPTGDLDDENTARILTLMVKTAEAGSSVLLVTHEREAELYADYVYKMDQGVLTRREKKR